MRVGVDATCLANERGYGRFCRELLTVLLRRGDADYVLFADARARAEAEALGGEVVVVQQRISPTLAAATGSSRRVSDMWRFTSAVRRAAVDVFFFPTVYSYFPIWPGTPVLLGVHDAIADRYPTLTFATRQAHWLWQAKTKVALRQARLVLTVSEFAAQDIHECYRIPRQRIRIAVEAPSRVYAPVHDRTDIPGIRERFGIPAGVEYFIYVGGFNPHKRLDVVFDALAALTEKAQAGTAQDDAPHVVCVGSADRDVFYAGAEHPAMQVERLGLQHRVHWVGFVPDNDLRYLLSDALALLLPSECEGFGLPAVEAAACGVPVIATTQSPLPVLLEGGGLFVPPGDVAALTGAMRTVLASPDQRAEMGRIAHARASVLSWDRAAAATWDALESIAA